MPTSPWIPVSQQRPPFHVTVRVTDGRLETYARLSPGLFGTQRRWLCVTPPMIRPTHWAPIPQETA